MNIGKSTELIRRIRRAKHAQKNVVCVKPRMDDRYSSDDIISHNKESIEALTCSKLMELENHIQKSNPIIDVIAIDEGQFFSDIVEFSEHFANQGITIIVAALNSTFERKPFGNIHYLIPLCEDVIKLTAICSTCKKEANFTKRIGNSKSLIDIGGQEKYEASCRGCFK